MPTPDTLALGFRIEAVERVAFAASPTLVLKLGVRAPAGQQEISSVLLRTMVRIEAGARTHNANETRKLRELFGEPSQWARASRSLLWAQVTSVVNAFSGSTTVEVHVPCSWDLAALASRYLRALDGGEVPITAQLSGSVFYPGASGLTVAPIPWSSEAAHRLPVQLFREVIDEHLSGSDVIALRHEVLDRLDAYRQQHGLTSWDAALEHLLRGGSGWSVS
jgi:hypothetical protein